MGYISQRPTQISKCLIQKCTQHTFEQHEYDDMNDNFRKSNISHSIRNTSGEIHNYTNTTCCTVLSINLILLLAISKQNQDGS